MKTSATRVLLHTGTQSWRFEKKGGLWALAGVEVKGLVVAQPESREDGFWVGGGAASSYEVLADSPTEKAVRFRLDHGSAVFRVRSGDPLPVVHVGLDCTNETICVFCASSSAAREHGAWVTRGWVATDADASEVFIDASNPLVFGHSTTGDLDVGYLFIPEVKGNVQPNGRTEQKTATFFKANRSTDGADRFRAAWQLRLGEKEPKAFAVLFDRDLGGRLSDVCEKYFAGAVDTLVDLTKVPRSNFDPEKCLQIMPVRLAAPDAFVPGWGLMMDEFPKASYPFAHDCVWQTPALLAFEGLATGRDWERNFAHYFLDKTPLEGPDGRSFFVRRPGGLTRWGYFATYRDGFVPLDGGSWWQADILYRTAMVLADGKLRRAALDMVLHDLNVKLDLEQMSYPPCWSAALNRVGDDHRDDWFKTPGLAYCAYMAAHVAFPETQDPKYLRIADRICEWFANYMVPEHKLNYLQGNNMHAVFSHYLTLAFLERYDWSHERRFLDMARDMAWIHIMTTCTTAANDGNGNPLTGTTCVGVRDCVDYDCAPNLCQEKDLNFVHMIGPLLDHVSGPAYAKYVALCRLVLDKDSWKSAWTMELRDTNLRTMYDTYPRGMANLIFALSQSTDPWVIPVEKLVSKSDVNITHERDLAVLNGVPEPRVTRVKIRFLQPGDYTVKLNGTALVQKTHLQLAQGLDLNLPGNSMQRVQVHSLSIDQPAQPGPGVYDSSTTWLSNLTPFAAQRGTGLTQPVYRTNLSFDNSPMSLGGTPFTNGLGCAANTVLVYELKGNFDRFKATVGVDGSVSTRTNPPPSVFFTVFVDGLLRFESGPMFSDTLPRQVDVDVSHSRVLMLRLSCNWDDNGQARNDCGDWAEARLTGKMTKQASKETNRLPLLRSEARDRE
ncbi:MAG TPA: NPCBM/NEW2 domain-containing protein [Verrucomicrobiae bacterium]|nr:NPCBM/NEW2 domain-containing protein [Verrucomicrobiae bacterium]